MVGCVKTVMYKLCLNAFLLWEGKVSPCLILNKLTVLAMCMKSISCITIMHALLQCMVLWKDITQKDKFVRKILFGILFVYTLDLGGDVLNYLNTQFLKAFNCFIPFSVLFSVWHYTSILLYLCTQM